MQDFKDIDNHTRRKRNARAAKGKDGRNAFKALQETLPRKRRLRIILPVLALILACYPLMSLFGSPRLKAASTDAKTPPAPAPLTGVDNWGAFRLAAQVYPKARA
ncbi:MAG TPA: penicillin-binding protein, partial [Geomonas sp.]